MRKQIRFTLATLSTFIVVAVSYLWLTFASPFLYNPPDNLPVIEEGVTYPVFVYGTLTKPWVRWLVIGRGGDFELAELPGFRKDKLDIRPDAGAVINGQVIIVSADEFRALDRYERLGIRYERVEVTLQDGRSAWVYRLLKKE
ncbi:gamma-glutamylcyclotransferase family protein [uncultured Amphritea sp.]|uniref:gamma-glutamylcyclotransferase family protein n=1 Tax=uncultured Amphritea sp. TaxID=981605 RepID=UPI002604E7E5|nr:gamma-glutamylcyclotransferase family protein [uncultured Amphritea sp.]